MSGHVQSYAYAYAYVFGMAIVPLMCPTDGVRPCETSELFEEAHPEHHPTKANTLQMRPNRVRAFVGRGGERQQYKR